MPIPAGPLPTPKTSRPNAGTVARPDTGRVVRPVSGTAPSDQPGNVQ